MSFRDLLTSFPRQGELGMAEGGPIMQAFGAIIGGPVGRVHADHGVFGSEADLTTLAFPRALIADLAQRVNVTPDKARAIAAFTLLRLIPAVATGGRPTGQDGLPAAVLDQTVDDVLLTMGDTLEAQHEYILKNGHAAQLGREIGMDEERAAMSLHTALDVFRERAHAQSAARR